MIVVPCGAQSESRAIVGNEYVEYKDFMDRITAKYFVGNAVSLDLGVFV
jgi:hypothetical protein